MTITQTATGLNSIRARMVDWQRRWLSRVEASLAHCRTMAAYPTALAVLEVEDSIAARTQDGIRLECLTLL
ncbi:MAG TPA: hypothetical protein VI704_02215, partial [Bacteroidota bacterium]|nr:hypothetical protein [Bacteroidota bacterium]